MRNDRKDRKGKATRNDKKVQNPNIKELIHQ